MNKPVYEEKGGVLSRTALFWLYGSLERIILRIEKYGSIFYKIMVECKKGVMNMEKVFLIFIVVGFVIPLITLIFSGIADFFDGIFDFFDFDLDAGFEIGDTTICLLPLSIQSICTGFMIYGLIGTLFYNGDNLLMVNLIAIGFAYLAAVTIQTLIRKLRKVENTTYSKEQLLLFDAKVIHTIVEGGYGSISITTYDGITSTYPAKALNPELRIPQDSYVTVVEFQDKVAIVKLKDEME